MAELRNKCCRQGWFLDVQLARRGDFGFRRIWVSSLRENCNDFIEVSDKTGQSATTATASSRRVDSEE